MEASQKGPGRPPKAAQGMNLKSMDTKAFLLELEIAQQNDTEAMEIEPELFEHLTRGQNTPYFTAGNPGIKVFKKGTMDKILKDENVNAEIFYERSIKNKAKKVDEQP